MFYLVFSSLRLIPFVLTKGDTLKKKNLEMSTLIQSQFICYKKKKTNRLNVQIIYLKKNS